MDAVPPYFCSNDSHILHDWTDFGICDLSAGLLLLFELLEEVSMAKRLLALLPVGNFDGDGDGDGDC